MREKKVNKYITDALFELLAVKPLSEITTQELITKAGVCRSSYYRNFYLLEDVIRQYGNTLSERISQIPVIAMEEPRIHMCRVYEQYLAERYRLMILDKRDLLYILNDGLYELCIRQIRNLGRFQGPYQADFFAGASISVIRAWIRNDFRESPAELADITYAIITENHSFPS